MEWRKITRSYWSPIIGAVVFLVGIPGMVDNFNTWKQWVGNMSPALSGLFVGVGATMICFWLVPLLTTRLRAQKGTPSDEQTISVDSVDFIGAWEIVDAYIGAALVDKQDGVKVTIKRDILDRFDKVTGAKLGEYEYNRALLHQWLQLNAARLLVEKRSDLV